MSGMCAGTLAGLPCIRLAVHPIEMRTTAIWGSPAHLNTRPATGAVGQLPACSMV